MTRLWIVAALTVACSPTTDDAGAEPETDTAATSGTPEPTDTPEPSGPDPWQVEGQHGNLVTVYRHFASGLPRGFDVHAVFAEQLPIDDLAWCLAGGPCAGDRPAPDSYVDLFIEPPIEDVAFSWLGDVIEVWRLDLPFITLTDPTVGYYSHTVASKPGEDDIRITIPDGGEWGGFSDSEVPVARDIEMLRPTPGERIDLSGLTVDFEWVPGGGGEVFLTILGEVRDDAPIAVLYTLEDDGAFTLDLEAHDIDAQSDVTIAVGRREKDEVEVNGNSLYMTAVDQQPYRPECLPWPEVEVAGDNPLDSRLLDPYYFSVTFEGVFEDAVIQDFTHAGDDQPTSARAIATFYDEGFDPRCRVVYDVSGDRSRSVDPWLGADINGSPLTVEAAWELDLESGWTDCGPSDILAAYSGSTDPRAYVALFDIGIGIGDTSMQPGGTRSGFVSLDGVFGYELMPATGYPLRDCALAIKSGGPLPPGSAVGDGYWELPYANVVFVIPR
ncbi:MAG: hypothetical protein ACI8PZ_004836 [Myxococcota bacterium]|jgi:hypothetical protein